MAQFRICTISNDLTQYQQMRESFEKAGFTESNSLYQLFDNSEENVSEPYSAFNSVLSHVQEPYIIFCHQDIVLDQGDDFEKLTSIIEQMNREHPQWGVLGNAGIGLDFQLVIRVNDPNGNFNQGPFPQPVISVDENFFVVKRDAKVHFSSELSGFHFYGADLCLNTYFAKKACYVVDFHLTHFSAGNRDEYFLAMRRRFQEAWGKKFSFFYVPTVCTMIFLSRHRLLTMLFSKHRVHSKYHQFFLHKSQQQLHRFARRANID